MKLLFPETLVWVEPIRKPGYSFSAVHRSDTSLLRVDATATSNLFNFRIQALLALFSGRLFGILSHTGAK